MASNIALILGAGPNTGLATVKYLSERGFKTIAVSRSPSEEISKAADIAIKADFSNPSAIKPVFEEVKAKIGIPNLVIYNPYIGLINPDPFAIPLDDWIAGQNINFISTYAAAQEAIVGFRQLPATALKTFTFTGNLSIHLAVPLVMHLGVSKNAGAYMIECGAIAYKKDGFRFYFVDERKEDGGPMTSDLGGLYHAEEFYKLATSPEQGPWEHTFVGGKGYVDFKGNIGDLSFIKHLEARGEEEAVAESK